MQQLPVDKDRGTVFAEAGEQVSSGIFRRICLPMILWAIVGIIGSAFISDLYRNGRDVQEDFAVYYMLGQELRQGIDPYTTDFTTPAPQRFQHSCGKAWQ
jgi:hypothetical protein